MPDLRRRRPRAPQWFEVAVWTATAFSRLLATYAIIQGVNVIGYGSDRWRDSPSLAVALQLPGQTVTWGALLLLAGTLALVGSLTRHMALTAAGHALAGVWSMFFAVAQAVSVLPPGSRGATTGVLVYAVEAGLFLTLAVGAWKLR